MDTDTFDYTRLLIQEGAPPYTPRPPEYERVVSGETIASLSRSQSEVEYSWGVGTPVWREETSPSESSELRPAPAITLQDLGIIPDSQLDQNVFGKERPWRALSGLEAAFLTFSVLSLLLLVSGAVWWQVTQAYTEVSFVNVCILHAVFCVYYTIHGIKTERPLEMFCLIIGDVILLVYVTVVCSHIGLEHTAIFVCLLCTWLMGPVSITMACYFGKRYYDGRHLVFRTAGANLEVQDAVFSLFAALALIVLDLQLDLSTLILLLEKHMSMVHMLALAGGVIITLLVSFLVYFAVRTEETLLFKVFLFFSVLQPAYAIFLIYRTARHHESFSLEVITIVCCVASVCVRSFLVITVYGVYRNFGKGIKEKVFPKKKDNRTLQTQWKASYNTFIR